MSETIDSLSLYFGEDYRINEYITVHNPTMGDVLNFGEQNYFRALHLLTAIPSDMKAMLWDMGINWMEISDFDFFCLLTKGLTPKDTKVFLGELNLSQFVFTVNQQNGEHVLYQELPTGDGITIDKGIYLRMMETLRKIHGLKPKVEIASTKTLTKILVELNRSDIKKANEKPFESSLLPLVSSMLNAEGFKYDLEGIKKMPYYTFMDSVKRITLIRSTTALLHGCYGGWIDGSKIDKKSLNWLKDFDSENETQRNITKTKNTKTK